MKKTQTRAKAAKSASGLVSGSARLASQARKSSTRRLRKRTTSRVVRDSDDSHHIEIRIWLRLLSCTTRIENVLKSRLRNEFGTSLARFDVLAQLHRFEEGLTMTELSRQLLVSNGAVTGLVDKLVAENMVLREPHSTDKRTVIVQLTAQGRSQFRRMAGRHEEWVISLLGDLSHEARVELLQNLTLLKRRLDDLADTAGDEAQAD